MRLKKIIKKGLIKIGLVDQPNAANNSIHQCSTSTIQKGENVVIRNSDIKLTNNSKLIIHDNVEILGYEIFLDSGTLEIGAHTKLYKGRQSLKPRIRLQGTLTIEHHCIIKNDFWIRFNGECNIGSYTGICEETEIRCDEKVTIGKFNMISYQCQIYDTNTHCIYPSEKRRSITINDYPAIGNEFEKPKTKPLNIGDDCWIGKRAVILKGTTLGNKVTIGTNTVVSNKTVNDNLTLYGNPAIIK